MKYLHQITRLQKPQILAVVVLTSLLSLGVGMTVLDAAADSAKHPQRAASETLASLPGRSSNFPDAVAQAVLQDASARASLPAEKLRILQAEPQNWPDGCLGLASPDTICTQAVVKGWRVTVVSGQGHLIYRTNDSGSLVKLATSDSNPPFPPDIVQ